MTTENITIRVLKPNEGYMLFNGEIYSDEVYLGVNDSPENWREISIEKIPNESEKKNEDNND